METAAVQGKNGLSTGKSKPAVESSSIRVETDSASVEIVKTNVEKRPQRWISGHESGYSLIQWKPLLYRGKTVCPPGKSKPAVESARSRVETEPESVETLKAAGETYPHWWITHN
ncbi:hypothetical protein [Alteribacillus sp. HJP-4]|uniref:hypothetical protein n=1 Tax=Alteribacillus sp. HJP-4 TaxID=2775394 RepID=UPI0035CCE6A0